MKSIIWNLIIGTILFFIVYNAVNGYHDENSKYKAPPIIDNVDIPNQEIESGDKKSFFERDVEVIEDNINSEQEELKFSDNNSYFEQDDDSFLNSDTEDELYTNPSTRSDGYIGQYTKNKYNSDRINPSNYYEDEYTTDGPKLYDNDGEFKGNLNGNKYDSDSVSNPYGRYGSKYSSDSINNPYGAGSKYRSDSPNNPYGEGLSVFDE